MILMTKTQISLGVLSIPSCFNTLGLVPGIITLLCVTLLTGWSNYMIGCFKIRHPEVYGLDSVGYIIFGRIGRDAMLAILQLCITSNAVTHPASESANKYIDYLFTAGSAFISISTCLNALSEHGACTAIFIAVAAIVGFLCASVRTMSKIGMVAWIGLVCIVASRQQDSIPLALRMFPDMIRSIHTCDLTVPATPCSSSPNGSMGVRLASCRQFNIPSDHDCS